MIFKSPVLPPPYRRTVDRLIKAAPANCLKSDSYDCAAHIVLHEANGTPTLLPSFTPNRRQHSFHQSRTSTIIAAVTARGAIATERLNLQMVPQTLGVIARQLEA